MKILLLSFLFTILLFPQSIINTIKVDNILTNDLNVRSVSIDKARPFNILLNLSDSSVWKIDSEESIVDRIKNKNEFIECIRSSHNQDILYTGKNNVSRSLNNGKKWENISDNIDSIKSISESAVKFGLLYVVDSSNNVFVTENSGYTWNKLDSTFDYIFPSKHDIQNVYALKNNSLYRSSDYGKNWKVVNNRIGNLFEEDPIISNLLYAVIDEKVCYSYDYGNTFSPVNDNLPQKADYKCLLIHPRDHKLITMNDSLIYIIDIKNYQYITPTALSSGFEILNIVKGSDSLQCYYFCKESENIDFKIQYKDEIIFEKSVAAKAGLSNYSYDYKFNKRKHYLVNLTKSRRAIVKDKILPGKYVIVLESEKRRVEKEFYIK